MSSRRETENRKFRSLTAPRQLDRKAFRIFWPGSFLRRSARILKLSFGRVGCTMVCSRHS